MANADFEQIRLPGQTPALTSGQRSGGACQDAAFRPAIRRAIRLFWREYSALRHSSVRMSGVVVHALVGWSRPKRAGVRQGNRILIWRRSTLTPHSEPRNGADGASVSHRRLPARLTSEPAMPSGTEVGTRTAIGPQGETRVGHEHLRKMRLPCCPGPAARRPGERP